MSSPNQERKPTYENRYTKGALVPDTGAIEAEPTGRRRDYIPSVKSGSRLPRMNVSSKEPQSMLYLISMDKLEFLLIMAPSTESYKLAQASFELAKKLKVSLRVCIMWPAGTPKGVERASKNAVGHWKNYIDVVEVKQSPTSPSWWDICQMSEKGAILVRPDDHIVWRTKDRVQINPYSEMERVLSAVLTLK